MRNSVYLQLARLAEDSKAGKAQTSAVSSSAAASNTTVSTTAAGSEAQTIAAILRLIQFMPRVRLYYLFTLHSHRSGI